MDASLFVQKAHEDAERDRLLREFLRGKNHDEEIIERTMERLQPLMLGLADVSLDVHRGDMSAAILKLQTNATVLIGNLALAVSESESWQRTARHQGNDE